MEMSFATLLARNNAVGTRRLGESVTYTDATGTTTTLNAVVSRVGEAMDEWGLAERRQTARILSSDLTRTPAAGDLIETASERFRVDGPPVPDEGMWLLTLLEEPQ
jgi:hypothetical protein